MLTDKWMNRQTVRERESARCDKQAGESGQGKGETPVQPRGYRPHSDICFGVK